MSASDWLPQGPNARSMRAERSACIVRTCVSTPAKRGSKKRRRGHRIVRAALRAGLLAAAPGPPSSHGASSPAESAAIARRGGRRRGGHPFDPRARLDHPLDDRRPGVARVEHGGRRATSGSVSARSIVSRRLSGFVGIEECRPDR